MSVPIDSAVRERADELVDELYRAFFTAKDSRKS